MQQNCILLKKEMFGLDRKNKMTPNTNISKSEDVENFTFVHLIDDLAF